MKKDGLVKRIVNPEDKRSYHLFLTKQGERLFEEVNYAYREQIKQLLARFSEDQLKAYETISTTIEETIKPDRSINSDFIDLQHRKIEIDACIEI